MKKNILFVLLSAGWFFLAVFLLSGYYFNKLSVGVDTSIFSPVSWGDHMQVFEGALQCSLTDEDLLERKQVLKESVFSKVTRKEEKTNGFVYYFKDEEGLLNDALEFIQKEKSCCPFFKFDVSILPFDHGFAIQISGSEEAIGMLKDFENNDF